MVRDKEIKLKDDEASHTLGGPGEEVFNTETGGTRSVYPLRVHARHLCPYCGLNISGDLHDLPNGWAGCSTLTLHQLFSLGSNASVAKISVLVKNLREQKRVEADPHI